MKIIKKALLFTTIIISVVSLPSCKKDNTILYNNYTMGNIVEGKYISDQGNIFNIVEQICTGKIDTMKRAMTLCDILKKTEGGAENEYDVRLNFIQKVLVKDIVALGTELGEDLKTEDAINIESVWISGGYINFAILFPYNPNNKVSHMINLIQEESAEADTYSFKLLHNGFEDKVTSETASAFNISGGYVSFPINSIIKEDEAKLSISWKGFDINNLTRTEDQKITGSYKKDSFEHAPASANSKRVAFR